MFARYGIGHHATYEVTHIGAARCLADQEISHAATAHEPVQLRAEAQFAAKRLPQRILILPQKRSAIISCTTCGDCGFYCRAGRVQRIANALSRKRVYQTGGIPSEQKTIPVDRAAF